MIIRGRATLARRPEWVVQHSQTAFDVEPNRTLHPVCPLTSHRVGYRRAFPLKAVGADVKESHRRDYEGYEAVRRLVLCRAWV